MPGHDVDRRPEMLLEVVANGLLGRFRTAAARSFDSRPQVPLGDNPIVDAREVHAHGNGPRQALILYLAKRLLQLVITGGPYGRLQKLRHVQLHGTPPDAGLYLRKNSQPP
jgi:hypothetical protein